MSFPQFERDTFNKVFSGTAFVLLGTCDAYGSIAATYTVNVATDSVTSLTYTVTTGTPTVDKANKLFNIAKNLTTC